MRVRRVTRQGAPRDREPGTLLPQMALANDQARESFETDPARNAGANTCPEKTTLKVCRTRAANTGVRRACRNPSLNRRPVLTKILRATASSSLGKEIKHDRSQPDLAGTLETVRQSGVPAASQPSGLGIRVGLARRVVHWHTFNSLGWGPPISGAIAFAKPAAPRALAAAAI